MQIISADWKLHRLTTETQVSEFDCGDEDLNDFIKNDALKNQNDWLSVTMVLENSSGKIAGFYTITPDTLHKGRIAKSDKIGDYPYQKYPAIKLARLAVDKLYQHQGFGKELMSEFFVQAWQAVTTEGGRFITIDAKNDAVSFYQQYGFVSALEKSTESIIPLYLDFYRYYNR